MKINREPIISVCIANYNGEEIIGPCLESVFSQEGDIPIEVIVHDDASTDGSIDFIQLHYPSVRLIPVKSMSASVPATTAWSAKHKASISFS